MANITETDILQRMLDMGAQSLDPRQYENLLDIIQSMCIVRKGIDKEWLEKKEK